MPCPENLRLCLKFGLRSWTIFPLLTSSLLITASPTRPSASRLGPSASSSSTFSQPSTKLLQYQAAANMYFSFAAAESFTPWTLVMTVWLHTTVVCGLLCRGSCGCENVPICAGVSFWGRLKTDCGVNDEKLTITPPKPARTRTEPTGTAAWNKIAWFCLTLHILTCWRRSWSDQGLTRDWSCWRSVQEMRGGELNDTTTIIAASTTAGRSRVLPSLPLWQRPFWTVSRLRWTDDAMTTPARPDDYPMNNPVDDLALTTDPTRTYSSEEHSCNLVFDVASSICEKPHPDVCDTGMGWTCAHGPDHTGRARRTTKRPECGVSNDCTKCIQLRYLCLIIISHESVVRVTAMNFSFFLYFHPLSYCLSSTTTTGDFRCRFNVRDRVFYDLYKVLTRCWKYLIMFLLLDKNGSILE